jgi:hypothetical protein
MSPPIALRDDELHEVLQADRMVPHDLRQVYLERLAVELRGREILGPGLVHAVAYQVARAVTWDAGRAAMTA